MDPAPMHHGSMGSTLGPLFGPVIGQAFTCVYNSFFMSKADSERLKLSREEYETSIRQYYDRMKFEREELRIQIEADKAGRRENHQLQRWPLEISALDILNASQKAQGKALNVIVCFVPDLGQEEAFFTETARSLLRKPYRVAAYAARAFTGSRISDRSIVDTEKPAGILFYSERAKIQMGDGDGLPATLYGLLNTEPTVLIEIRIPEPDQITFQAYCWGIGFDHAVHPWETGDPIPPVDLTPLPSNKESPEYKVCEEKRKYNLALYLASMVGGAGDMFRTLQHGYSLPDLVLPTMISDPAYRNFFPGMDQAVSWEDLITKHYLETYDKIATINRSIAAELAAKAAFSFRAANQDGLFELFFRKALEIAGNSSPSVMFPRLLSQEPQLKLALLAAGVPEWESARNAHAENTLSLRERAILDIKQFQESMRSQNA